MELDYSRGGKLTLICEGVDSCATMFPESGNNPNDICIFCVQAGSCSSLSLTGFDATVIPADYDIAQALGNCQPSDYTILCDQVDLGDSFGQKHAGFFNNLFGRLASHSTSDERNGAESAPVVAALGDLEVRGTGE